MITGINGQLGSYLAEFLLDKGHEVYGIIRKCSTFPTERIEHLGNRLNLCYGDLTDNSSLRSILNNCRPDYIFNMAALSHVKVSFELPIHTSQVDALAVLSLLEEIKDICPKTRLYQSSTSELYGGLHSGVLNEQTPFNPRSPYAAAKLFAHNVVDIYQKAYGIFATSGIVFNSESPKRSPTFVTRKITQGVVRTVKGIHPSFSLGNLDAIRDWSHAKDTVEAIYKIITHTEPDYFCICSGEGHTVREFVEEAFKCYGKEVIWEGEGKNEVGVVDGKVVVDIDERYYRPLEVPRLVGDNSKAKKILGWEPKISFEELVKEMVEEDEKIICRGS